MNKTLFAIILPLAAVTLLAIPGDLNEDGRLDIADLARLDAMVSQEITADDAADLNFDGAVNNADLLLLYDAVTHGKALPVKLLQKRLHYWDKNISFSAGGLTVDIPCTCYTSQLVSLSTTTPMPDFDIDLGNAKMTTPVIVTNLPGRPQIQEAVFTLEVPEEHNEAAGPPMLLVGHYISDRLQKEPPQWRYMAYPALEEFNVAYADRKLTWTPDFALTEGFESTPISLAVIYTTAPSTRGAASEPESTPQTRDDDFFFEKDHSFYSFIPAFGIWHSQHFSFSMHAFASESSVKTLARDFERAYTLIGNTGMSQDKFKTLWGHTRIPVNVVANPKKEEGKESKSQDAQCVGPGFLNYPYIDVPLGVLDASQRAETCCHELFHYHQYAYATHNTALFMEEMAGTWSEYLISPKGEEHMPNNYLFGRAPINGLYMKSWTSNFYVNLYHLFAEQHAGEHGYNLVPFARWLTQVKYPGKNLWPAVFSSAAYLGGDGIGALQAGIKAMDATDSLATIYPEFIYDYFAEKPGIPMQTKSGAWQLFFDYGSAQDGIDRFNETGQVTNIKSAEEMFQEDKSSHTFQIQNFGGATWLLRYYKPWDYLADYSNAVATFSVPAGSDSSIMDFQFFAMTKVRSTFELKPINFVKIDTQRNTASMVFPLEDLATKPDNANNGFFNFIGLVAVLANDQSPADSRRSLTMTIAYDGPVVLKNLVGIHPSYYDPRGLMKTSSDFTFTPLNGATLQFSKLNHWSGTAAGQHIVMDWATATLSRPAITQETEIALNITGAIRDLTSELTLSGEERPVFTGRFLLSIYRGEEGGGAGTYIPWTPPEGVEYNSALGVSTALLAPVAPSKQSNFTIRFKVAPPPAGDTLCSYTIGIDAVYRVYEKGEEVSYDIRECGAATFSIQVPAAAKKPSQQ